MKDSNNEKMYPHPYYPVGSIYLSVIDTNPSTWFGGTWELISKGRTLVGVDENDTDFNTVKKTGGEKTHTLTINEIPSHNHHFFRGTDGTSYFGVTGKEPNGGSPYQVDTSSAGGGQSHNNLQPYFTCYIWCRTA